MAKRIAGAAAAQAKKPPRKNSFNETVFNILDSIEDGFFTIDRNWRFTFVNKRAAEAGRLRPEELIGQNIWERWPQLLGTQLEGYYRQAMSEGIPVNFEHRGIMTGAWYEIRVYPSVEGISVFWIDISERKELEQRLAYHSLLLSTIHDGVMATDIDRRITAWNRGAEELTGWKTEEVIGKTIDEVLRLEGPAPAESSWLPLQEGKPVILEVPLRRKDGQLIQVATTTMPVLDPEGNLIGFVSAGRDVSEQKQASLNLQEAYREMEDRVKDRTKELTELQWHLIESTEAERLRFSRELHDGPVQELYGLMYQASLLENKLPNPILRADIHELIERIKEVNEDLRTIAYELRPVSLTQLGLEKAIREYVSRISLDFPQIEMDLNLQPDQDLLPESQRLALFRVCQVGLNNIVRHSGASRAEIRLVCGRDLVILEIKDNGRGFEVPKNLLSLARAGHLGLVGAVERVEAMGGTLEIQSQTGEGARLIACLPLKEHLL
jgi:PAS domain S-box-containing protein